MSTSNARKLSGKVYLVGAGPGDPGLLTRRGQACLERAEVVLYDYLASPELLALAPAGAERICLGRHGQGRLMTQEEVCQLMVDHAAAGRQVVRLKGGDPGIFGRLAEEAAALRAAKLPFEVVPGITTAIAAGAYAGITLTDREHASCVALITGREQAGKSTTETLDYAALARFPGTLVYYMGVTTAPEWSSQLIAHGKPPETPVRIVRHCSLPDQQAWNCRLDEVAQQLAPGRVRPPVVVVVGQVADEDVVGDWFTSRPLFGQTVLVTRPAHQAGEMGAQLAELGAQVLYQPAIEIAPPRDWSAVDQAIERLAKFDWLVFSSRNGVDYFLRRLMEQGRDLRALSNVKIAAIGPATAAALEKWHLQADLQPAEYRAEALAAKLAPQAAGQRFLLLRASRGREVLAQQLTQAGGEVEETIVYESRDVTVPAPEIAQAMAAGEITWTTVTSSAIARSLIALFGDSLAHTQLAAISPLTGEVLSQSGFAPQVTAKEYTGEGLVEVIREASG